MTLPDDQRPRVRQSRVVLTPRRWCQVRGHAVARHSLRPLDFEDERRRKTSGTTCRESAKMSADFACDSLQKNEPLWIELGVPVEIVEPAVVQVVRREQPAVAVQLVHGGCVGHLPREHFCLLRRQIAFS
jgi:hypothetical protein